MAKIFEATGHLAPYGVMCAPETRTVFDTLRAAGGNARFVGGIVRDALLKRDLDDVDIACDLAPEESLAALENAGIRVVPTGLKHGTITAVINGLSYEITTLRVDVTSNGRHADVRFTDDWLADARRRDFTFNAIYCDLDGTLYDIYEGVSDLHKGIVNFIGVPQDRIEEDYLRILRFFRFQAWFGRPPVNPVGADACRINAAGLLEISKERIRDEVMKLLRARSPAMTLSEMIGFGVLPVILPQLRAVEKLRMIQWLDSTALADPAIIPDPLRRLAALYMPDNHAKQAAGLSGDNGDIGAQKEAARDFAKALKFSNEEAERFAAMVELAGNINVDMTQIDVQHILYFHGPDLFRDAVLLAWATRGALPPRIPRLENEAWQSLLVQAHEWTPKTFPISGKDILACGLAMPGPEVGRLIAKAQDYWIAGNFKPDEAQLIDYLKSK